MNLRILLAACLFLTVTFPLQEANASSCINKPMHVECETNLLGPIYDEWGWGSTSIHGTFQNPPANGTMETWFCTWGMPVSPFTITVIAGKTAGPGITIHFIPAECIAIM